MNPCGRRTAPRERTQASRPTCPALPRHGAPFARPDRAAARSLTRDRPGIPLRPGRLQGAASQGALPRPVRALQHADQRCWPRKPKDALPPMRSPRGCEVGQAAHRSRDASMAPTPRPTCHHDRPQPSIRPQASTARRRRPTRPPARWMGGRTLAGRERRSIPLRHGAARQRCGPTGPHLSPQSPLGPASTPPDQGRTRRRASLGLPRTFGRAARPLCRWASS